LFIHILFIIDILLKYHEKRDYYIYETYFQFIVKTLKINCVQKNQ